MMIKMRDIFGFIIDLKKIIYGLEFKIILKRNNNDIALFRVNAGAGAIAIDGHTEFNDMFCCIPSIDSKNDNRSTGQKGIIKENNVDFSYYERKTFYENVLDANNFLFDLGMESDMERSQYVRSHLVLRIIMLMSKLMMQVLLI